MLSARPRGRQRDSTTGRRRGDTVERHWCFLVPGGYGGGDAHLCASAAVGAARPWRRLRTSPSDSVLVATPTVARPRGAHALVTVGVAPQSCGFPPEHRVLRGLAFASRLRVRVYAPSNSVRRRSHTVTPVARVTALARAPWLIGPRFSSPPSLLPCSLLSRLPVIVPRVASRLPWSRHVVVVVVVVRAQVLEVSGHTTGYTSLLREERWTYLHIPACRRLCPARSTRATTESGDNNSDNGSASGDG